MRPIQSRSLLAILFLIASLHGFAQSNVISANYTGDIDFSDHEWMVGTKFFRCGLVQYSTWEYADGRVTFGSQLSDEKIVGVRHKFTIISFGSHSRTVPMPALLVAIIGIVLLASLGWLAVSAVSWTSKWRRKRDSPDQTIPY
jgi:hypothetical protein